MISIKEVEIIHNILIDKFGGSKGIRDLGLLESALARPYATFDGNDLYPNAIEKAAAILESIIINHPFIDGNKRTAYTLMRLILLEFHFDISASQEEKYSFVISASTGEYRFEEIKKWIESNLQL
ncbi:death-on-curing protein [Flavobacterium noncentrifugens]|uniref:Death on curing protein n=1 Tax=Flavobacterium noncentrifugens TaxID=1128970 RepID=A0A1G9DBZ5_9FLAO|nr:type II toxin-antitoxin system death-on-curing family toxin [Flavobacterium noncentrifugens]GEP52734.1 death-on-curing protein [Flavobacterium noncentrifugens]SDK61421.1 death on curing protein [Flavobacterium noncentrifugens]